MKKTHYVWIIAMFIAGLVITISASIPAGMDGVESSTKTILEDVDCPIEYFILHRQSVDFEKIDDDANLQMSGLNSDNSSQVTGGEYDELHPSVTGSPIGEFYALIEEDFEGGGDYFPAIYQSDTGEDWTLIASFPELNCEYTGADFSIEGPFGTCAPCGYNSIIIVPLDGNTYWVWSPCCPCLPDFRYHTIASYDDPDPAVTVDWGFVALCGDDPDEGLDDIPMIFYQEKGTHEYGLLGHSSSLIKCSNPHNCVDPVTVIGYAVFEQNDPDGKIYIRKDDFGEWRYNSEYDYYYHPDKGGKLINESDFDLKYPAISVYDDTGILVAQKVGSRANEIICYYSTNQFNTVESVIIAEGEYPDVEMIGPSYAVCTFMDGDVLKKMETFDGGKTWEPPEGVEEVFDANAKPGYRTVNLNEVDGIPYGIWEDNRSGNIDVYFREIEVVLPPILEVTIQSGWDIGVKAIVKNVGEGAATEVSGTITVTGGILDLINKTVPSDISALASNVEAEIKTGLIFGLGRVAITANASASGATPGSDEADGMQILIFTKVK